MYRSNLFPVLHAQWRNAIRDSGLSAKDLISIYNRLKREKFDVVDSRDFIMVKKDKKNPTIDFDVKLVPYHFIPSDGALYIPGITVFKKDQTNNYGALKKPFDVDIVASAAFNLKNGTPANYREGTKDKIRAQLRVAKHHGHKTLVLSAFGCGAFRNLPEEVASLYNEIFNESEFNNVFKKVIFGIYDTSGKNIAAFASEFEPSITFDQFKDSVQESQATAASSSSYPMSYSSFFTHSQQYNPYGAAPNPPYSPQQQFSHPGVSGAPQPQQPFYGYRRHY